MNPLYFTPDPMIPDADLLGYGDLTYDNGTTNYLGGFPEISAGLPAPPMGPPTAQQAGAGQPYMPPPTPIGGGMAIDMTGQIAPMQSGNGGMTGVQDPQTGDLLQPGEPSNFLPALGGEIANAAQGYPQPLGQAWDQQMGSAPAPQPEQAAQSNMPSPTPIGGGLGVSMTGEIAPLQSGGMAQQPAGPSSGMGSGGMVPYERSGAIPQDMAQRQLSEMGAQNQATLGATQQARADEVRMVRQMTLQQMAQNEAMRVQQEQQVAENQAKVQRFQQEQQDLINAGVETDLVSARGPIGAGLAVVGAMLLGAMGSDAGLRSIDRTIDQHVRLQVQQRDTKLGLLAQQIGSSQQAIAMGKAALYKGMADQAELMAQKTKSDAYEAQTPMVVEQLRQKQLENMRKAEQDSMGKLIERAPVAPKPPSAEMMQKYGELRRDRDASLGMGQRIEQQLGLMWAPGQNGQPGHYANADEVLKNGIQGVGSLEQWVPDFVYSTMGGTTEEGYQVRGAAEALAYATIRQMQPTGPISNSDIQAAVKANSLNTEEGLVRALERIHTNAERQQLQDAAQFGPDVVGEYNRRFQASGGQAQTAQPAASRPASLEELRAGSAALRAGGQQEERGSAAAQMQPEQRMAQVAEDIQAMVGQNLPPEGVAILLSQAALESGNGDSQGAANGNMFGHKRTGNRRGFEANTTEGAGSDARRTRAEFAAYPTIADGVADHLSLLQRRYPRAWEALQMGDPDAYVAALKDGGYFTASEDDYRRGILRGMAI